MTEVNEVNIARGGKMAEGDRGGIGRLIKLVMIVVLLVALAGGGYFLVQRFLLSDSGVAGGGGGTPALAEVNELQGSIPDPHYLELGDFIVNLADGRRYLKIKIQVMLSDEKAKEYLQLRMAEVRDVVLRKLQSLSGDDLKGDRSHADLRKKLHRQIFSLFPNKESDRDWKGDPLKKLLITEFYLQ